MTSHDIMGTALKDVKTDEFDWPIDDEHFDQYLRQFAEAGRLENCVGSDQTNSAQRSPTDSVGCVETEKSNSAQQYLFDVGPDEIPLSKPVSESDVDSLVRDAFFDMNDGASTDLVVADPIRNFRFVQACWRRGLQGSQAELNHWLLNARKAKKIGKINGVIRYQVPREIMEAYEFASEVGARLLQDRIFNEEACWVSLDDILCDPRLGRRFLTIAESITPGFEELDYRWAALSIRKAMNRKVPRRNALKRPVFSPLGTADEIDACSVPDQAGFFWIKSCGVDFYIGHTCNLRDKVQAMVDADLGSKIRSQSSSLLFGTGPLEYFVAPSPTMRVSHRFEIKKLVVSENAPKLNITKEMDRRAA